MHGLPSLLTLLAAALLWMAPRLPEADLARLGWQASEGWDDEASVEVSPNDEQVAPSKTPLGIAVQRVAPPRVPVRRVRPLSIQITARSHRPDPPSRARAPPR